MTTTSKRTESFVKVPKWIILEPRLNVYDKAVLSVMAAYDQGKGVWLSQYGIADVIGTDRETVRRTQKRLASYNLLIPRGEGRRGKQETYDLNLWEPDTVRLPDKPDGTVASSPAATKLKLGGKSRKLGGTSRELDGVAAITETQNENDTKKREPDVTSTTDVEVEPGDDFGSDCSATDDNERGALEAANAEDDFERHFGANAVASHDDGEEWSFLAVKATESPGTETARGWTKAEVNDVLITPDGYRATDDRDEAEDAVNQAIAETYGETLYEFDRLVERYGAAKVMHKATWLSRMVAAQYAKGKPVAKPTGLLIRAVEQDWPVDPKWPEYDDALHIVAAREEARRRNQARGTTSHRKTETSDEREFSDEELIPF